MVKDDKVIFRLPIGSLNEEPEGVSMEMNKHEIERLAKIYSIAANEKRLRIMLELTRRGEMRFTDVLQVALNPKLVRDCMEPMMREGMVLHEGRGSCYKQSELGTILAFTMTTGLGRLLRTLEELEEEGFE